METCCEINIQTKMLYFVMLLGSKYVCCSAARTERETRLHDGCAFNVCEGGGVEILTTLII